MKLVSKRDKAGEKKKPYKETYIFMSVTLNDLLMKKLSALAEFSLSDNSDTVMDSENQLHSLLTYKVSKFEEKKVNYYQSMEEDWVLWYRVEEGLNGLVSGKIFTLLVECCAAFFLFCLLGSVMKC